MRAKNDDQPGGKALPRLLPDDTLSATEHLKAACEIDLEEFLASPDHDKLEKIPVTIANAPENYE